MIESLYYPPETSTQINYRMIERLNTTRLVSSVKHNYDKRK